MIILEVFANDGRSQGYLSKADFETNGPNYPTGSVECSAEPWRALRFDDVVAAMAFIKTQSKTCPLRPDGEPNRPLSALNFLMIQLDDVHAAQSATTKQEREQ